MSKLTIHSFPKGDNEEVRVSAGEYREKIYFDVRVFFKNEENNEMFPTKKGITLALDLLPELKKGLQKIEAENLKNKNFQKT